MEELCDEELPEYSISWFEITDAITSDAYVSDNDKDCFISSGLYDHLLRAVSSDYSIDINARTVKDLITNETYYFGDGGDFLHNIAQVVYDDEIIFKYDKENKVWINCVDKTRNLILDDLCM